MSKNVVTMYTDTGEGKGFHMPVNNLYPTDTLDASLMTDREITIGWASAITSIHTIRLRGKNIAVECYSSATQHNHLTYGDVPTLTNFTIPVSTTKVVIRGSVFELSCTYQGISSIDVTKMPCLEILRIQSNNISTLDLSKNVALTHLNCEYNQLTSLDVTKNVALAVLECYNNQLTSLDVTKNVALAVLECYNNQLTSLDVTKNVALESFNCYNNQLTSLDVTKNVALTSLYCDNNLLTSLDLRQSKQLQELSTKNNNNPLVYLAETPLRINFVYAYPQEDGTDANLDDINAQIWALPLVDAGIIYIFDEDGVVFDDIDPDAIAHAENNNWEVLNEEY